MDQEKIGKFIAECRKERNITQVQLAEKLNLTDKAISKWETGKGMPDSSVMIELCNELNINVNELLSGERLSDEDYQDKASENIVSISRESEKNKRIKNRIVILLFTILFILVIGAIAIIIYKNTEISVTYDERIMNAKITDNNIEISCKGLSLIHFYHKEINTDTETLIFITGKMLLENKIHSHFETWDSMAQLINGNEPRFASIVSLDRKSEYKDKIKVYYTNISLKKINNTNQDKLQEIIEQSHLITTNY